jgi:hypothetical protein
MAIELASIQFYKNKPDWSAEVTTLKISGGDSRYGFQFRGIHYRTLAMSYLDSPRLHFRRWFQAEVWTTNNDIRFFQNSSFVSAYQELNQNGSSNPEGTAIFRLLDCVVTGGLQGGIREP